MPACTPCALPAAPINYLLSQLTMKTTLLLASALVVSSALLRADNEIGFIEKFALAPDRARALAELPPGTEEFFFFHALHFQNTKNTAELRRTLDEWRRAFPTSSSRDIIDNREALLAYDADPRRTLAFLTDKLRLQFNHQQEVRDRKPDLPTALDPARIARDVFLREALKRDDLAGISERELERLVRDKTPLRIEQLRALLSRLTQPDVPGLVEVIAAELNRPEATPFGAFPIHQKLLPGQLDQLVKLVPRLANEPQFVHAKIRKLQPGADEDAEFDPAVREAWLDRVWGYVRALPPAFNSLKASVLYRRLDHDRKKGVYDRERFLEYLRLPRRTNYIAPRWSERLQNTETYWCDLSSTFEDAALHFGADRQRRGAGAGLLHRAASEGESERGQPPFRHRALHGVCERRLAQAGPRRGDDRIREGQAGALGLAAHARAVRRSEGPRGHRVRGGQFTQSSTPATTCGSTCS